MIQKALVVLIVACVATFVAPATDAQAGVKARKAHLVNRAKSQMGTKYRYDGESPRRGFDCSGLTRWTFKKVTGLPHNSMQQYRLQRRSGYKAVDKRARLDKATSCSSRPQAQELVTSACT